MRRLAYMPLVLLAAACGPKEPETPPTTLAAPAFTPPPATMAPSGSGFLVEVVSVDAPAKTVTVKDASATGTAGAGSTSRTILVEGTGVDMLASLKAGDRVTVTCREVSVTTGASPGLTSASPGAAGTTGTPGTGTTGTGTTGMGTGTGTGTTGTGSPLGTSGGTFASCSSIVSIAPASGAGLGTTASPGLGTTGMTGVASPSPRS